MTYSSWLYDDMKYLKQCSQLLWIFLLMMIIPDKTMTTQQNSQANINIPLSENVINSDFCYKNWKSLLSNSVNRPIILSSKYGPSSSSNYNSPSSIDTSLPQGSSLNFTYTPHSRIDSNTFIPSIRMAGCISLQNYYWRPNMSSSVQEQSTFGVQIFIFHINNKTDRYANAINLRILLDSTQDVSFQLPVTIVLISFQMGTFYLSVLSYLSRTEQPIHIILTNVKSDVVIIDKDLTESDMSRIFISVLDSSYNSVFQLTSHSSDDANLEKIRENIVLTSLYKYGYFSGVQYNSVVTIKHIEKLWLFDYGKRYSQRKPDIKLVAIYMVSSESNAIDLVLGRPEGPRNPLNNVFYEERCILVKKDNYMALADRIYTFEKSNFDPDEYRTCSYYITPSQSVINTPITKQYRTVTWLHFKKTMNVNIHLKLSSGRIFKDNETHLVILTADIMQWSTIYLETFFLHTKVLILSNISLNQFDQRSRHSSLLISVEQMMNTNRSNGLLQQQIVANYIAASASAVMQTTIYKLKLFESYEIRVNVDDSQVHPYASILVSPSCWCKGQNHVAPTLSIDLRRWKLANKWIPTQFQFGIKGTVLKKTNETFVTLTTQRDYCSRNSGLKPAKVYGIWRDKKYLLFMPFEYSCVKFRKNVSKTEVVSVQSATDSPQTFIALSENGFNVFNDSKFKTLLNERQLRDKERLFIELTQHVAWSISLYKGINLGDCYITNQEASENDLKYSNQSRSNYLQKSIIVRGGCINRTSLVYPHIDTTMAPINHYVVNHLLYRFSVVIDANRWASLLSLQRQWFYQNKLKVHLYCGIQRCYRFKSQITHPLHDVDECQADKQCLKPPIPNQVYMYFGAITIVKDPNKWPLKISVLLVLITTIVLLLLVLAIFLRRLYNLRAQYKHQPWPVTNRRRHSLSSFVAQPLLTITQPSNTPLATLACSLQQLLVDSDKSLILRASYLSSSIVAAASEPTESHPNSVQPLLQHPLLMCSRSVSELHTLAEYDTVLDRPRLLYSWPLFFSSTSNRNRRSYSSQQQHPPPPLPSSSLSSSSSAQHKQLSHRLTLSNKLKISVTLHSDHKLVSSNRTTVSGESASANDIAVHKSFKWWSPLSNGSLNNNFVISRN